MSLDHAQMDDNKTLHLKNCLSNCVVFIINIFFIIAVLTAELRWVSEPLNDYKETNKLVV